MYMVNQRNTTAVRDGYRQADRATLERQLTQARQVREWLEALQIDAGVRATLVEPIGAIEEAFAEIVRAKS